MTTTLNERPSARPQDGRAFQKLLACEYSQDPELSDPLYLARALKAMPEVFDELEVQTKPVMPGGRPRTPGSYALLYVTFLCSDVIDVKTWCDRWASSPVWELAGFEKRPNHRTVALRFIELEEYSWAFEEAAQKLIRTARASEPRIGRYVHVDATHFTSHGQLMHCCPDLLECARLWKDGPGRKPRKVLPKATGDIIKSERHLESGKPENEAGGFARQLASVPDDDPRVLKLSEEERAKYAFFELSGHLYKTRDKTAGVRHYPKRTNASGPGSKERFTEGGQLAMGVCDLIGAPVGVLSESVGVQEFELYPSLLEKVEMAVGDATEAVITDKGFHTKAVFELNSRHGISTICDWRPPGAGTLPIDLECEHFDRHGVVRCRHCGGDTHMSEPGLGHYVDERDNPRLRVQCRYPRTPDCKGPQSIACSTEWRLLQPINRSVQLFYDLLNAHQNRESLFHHWRRRYGVAGNDFAERPKRRQSVPCQRLRAAAGMLVEWLRLCLRHGWAGDHRILNFSGEVERDSGALDWQEAWDERRLYDLDVPYGPAAYELGFAMNTKPPGRRQREALKNPQPDRPSFDSNLTDRPENPDAPPF